MLHFSVALNLLREYTGMHQDKRRGKTMTYKFKSEDRGFYRTYYSRRDGKRPFVYCIQNDGSWGKDDFKFYRCSQDGEPDYEVRFPDKAEFDRLVYPCSLKQDASEAR